MKHTLTLPNGTMQSVERTAHFTYAFQNSLGSEQRAAVSVSGKSVFVHNVKNQSLKNQLESFFRADFEEYIAALRSGEKHIVVIRVGSDYEYNALGGDDFEFRYALTNEILHCENIAKSNAVGTDVTALVLQKYDAFNSKSADAPTPDAPTPDAGETCWECGRTYTRDEARRLLKSGEARREGLTGFYCGC